MTKLTSGCTLVSLLRRSEAVLADFADADQTADNTNVHNAAQHAAVPPHRADRGQNGHAEAVGGLGRSQPDLAGPAHAAGATSDQVAMRLAEAEAATAQPVERGPGARHDLVDEGIRRKGDAAAGLDHGIEELGILAAGLA